MDLVTSVAQPRPAPEQWVASATPAGRPGPDRRFRVALGAVGLVLLLVAVAPFAFLAIQSAVDHRVFIGVDSFAPSDDLQYLAWVRDAQNGLIRNLYGASGHAVFLHPIWSPSGWLQRLTGVSDAAIMLFWTVTAAIVMLAGVTRLAVRYLPDGRIGARAAAVLLALFGGLTPAILLAHPLAGGLPNLTVLLAGNDLVPAASLWGYAPMALAIGLMPFAVDGVGRAIDGRLRPGRLLATAAIGALVAWLHPWQGEILLVICVGLTASHALDQARGRHRRGSSRLAASSWTWLRGPLVVLVATALPLGYYLVLSRIDHGWAVANANNDNALGTSFYLTAVLPLAVVAMLSGWRVRRERDLRPLLLWPLATLLVVAVTPSGQNRALAGIALPVAVLVVRAWPRPSGRRRAWTLTAAAGLLAVLGSFGVLALNTARNLNSREMTSIAELTHSDVRAADLAGRDSGGDPIVASFAVGAAIPALADAPSWLGQSVWTPDWISRANRTVAIFLGRPTPASERSLLGAVPTHVLVQQCGYGRSVERALAPLGFRLIRVGCANVYVRRNA